MGDTSRPLAVWVLYSFLLVPAVCVNSPPQMSFSVTNYRKMVSEDTAMGTELFTVTATDADVSDKVTISTDNPETEALVTLVPEAQSGTVWKARVLLKSRLDKDRSPASRPLLFKVSDGFTDIAGKVTLIITDVNDNPPFFENLPYRLELPERTNQTNSVVYRVSASDPDQGPRGSAFYSMTAQAQDADNIYNTTFVMYNQQKGEIRLERELDYENRNFYQYQVTAKDHGTPPCPGDQCSCSNWTEPEVVCKGLPAIFTVTVTDVQDTPPLFQRLPYITQLPENASVDTTVLTISAVDGDRGVPNQVNFSIADEEKYPFSMDADSGVITVRSPGLDADTPEGRSYFITVMATEMEAAGSPQYGETTATTQVSITVLDVNDNPPQFGHHVYYATVQENTPIGVNIAINTTVEVTDKDQNTNSQFRLTVEKDGAPFTVFSTRPTADTINQGFTTVSVSVNDSSVLDYEQIRNLTFQIRAEETSTSDELFGLTTIVLSILDMNDNSPHFSDNQTSAVNVTEHAQAGTVLATLTATDQDSGDFGTVAYYLEEDYGGRFAIGELTGQLTVEGDIDRDDGEERFSLVVLAKDNVNANNDNQRLTTRHAVVVTVQDINDNAPRFLTHLDQVAVQENAEINTALTTLKAVDDDQGENGDVRYHVFSIHTPASLASQDSLFDIRATTGEVFVNASLIGHPGLYNVTFMASDRGKEPLNSTTNLVVEVRDVNVNPPKFVEPDQDKVNTTANQVPSVTVTEEEDIGTFIFQLKASDADTGSNGQVLFYLDPDLGSAFLSFHVDPVSGNLTNRARLDSDEGTDRYQINLRAQDQGKPISLSSNIPFIVRLKDIDDNPPQFPQAAPLVLGVKEQVADVPVGLVNISTDKDRDPENRVACYYLYGGDMLPSFRLNKITGELRLMAKLDRTQTLKVGLVVKTTRNCSLEDDHFTSDPNNNGSSSASDHSLLEVEVEVEDINNHPPVFDKDALTVGLLYDVAIGTEVIDLTTYTSDEDTALHSRHMYRLLKFRGPNSGPGQPLDSTFAVSTNGSVVTRRLFQPDEGGNFVLTVMAYDVDNLTDTANLTIYLVSDLQRVKLIFNADPNQVNRIKGDMVRRLGEVLGMTIIVDKIATHLNPDGTPDPTRTDMFIHARYIPSGEIVPTSELVNAFDYNQKVLDIFNEYQVAYISPLEIAKEDSDDDDAQKVFIIVIIVVVIVCFVLIIVFISTVQRYRRRLRAATTSAFVSSKSMPTNHIPPGTNKYFTSENPLFGKDMKANEFHRAEDKDNDSLDDNAVDPASTTAESREDPDPEEEQEMYLDMYDDDLGHGAQANHLAMVLKEYDSQNAQAGNTRPSSDRPGLWGPPTPGSHHAKSDSGFGEHNAFDLDNLQHTDI